jgi:OOP family OmpA-OmpF porin
MTSNHTLLLLTRVALGCLLATSAFAQDGGYFYGGLSVGQSRARIDDERITSGLLASGLTTTAMTLDERDTAYKAFGGYQFNRYLGVEGGYFHLGRFGFNSTTSPTGTLDGRIKLDGGNLDLVATVPLGEQLALIGRLGAQYARARDRFTSTGAVTIDDPNPRSNEVNPKLGFGLQYAVSRSFLVRAEAERYRVNDAVGNNGGVNVFSLSLVFPFGRAPMMAMAPPPAPRVQPAPAPMAPPPAPPVAAPPPVAAAPAPPPPPPPSPPARRSVNFSADSLFTFDKSEIRPEGKAALDVFVRDLQGTLFDVIRVTGHTDRLGSLGYNQTLSQRRAESVKSYLVSPGGIDAGKLTATGAGEAEPVTKPQDCKGNTPSPKLIACLQPDRRVVVEVTGTR